MYFILSFKKLNRSTIHDPLRGLMAKEHLIMWKAIERGWQASDLKRIKNKIYQLWEDGNGSIPFEDVEFLCFLLCEPINYKTEWSLIRLCKDGVIDIFEKDGLHYIDLIEFNNDKNKKRKKKAEN